jgi:hypothetical protein
MRPTDNDPKGNDPIDRNPTNEEIVAHLQRGLVMRMHFCPLIGKKVGKKMTTFELRTNFQDAEHRFEGMWLDGTGTKVLAGSINKEHSRAKALASLIEDKCFPSVEAWVVACRNALGDNIDKVSLAGSIFVEGKCVDELLDALEDKRFAEVFVEPVASPAEDKTDEKELNTENQTDTKNLATEVKILKREIQIITQIVTILCEADYHRE